MAKLPFALQLHSVREPLQQDLAGALKRVKEIGYDHVETAALPGLGPEAFQIALEEAGLTAISAHVPFELCERDISAAIAHCHALGVSRAAIPGLPPENRATPEGFIASARQMEGFGRAFREADIQLCYHNHADEFLPANGKTIFDALFDTAAPDALAVELDAGWAHYGCADPVALLKKYANRTPLVHIKDLKARVEGEPPVHTELGNGATPLGPILKAAGETGVSWLIVEQDESGRDPLESARMNAAYMRVHVF